jgi:hypothetical protein
MPLVARRQRLGAANHPQLVRRDRDVLRPFLERMRTEGPDFLQRNVELTEKVRRTLVDLDGIEKELKKAAKAIDAASGLTTKYRIRLQIPCDHKSTSRKVPTHQERGLSHERLVHKLGFARNQ